MVSLASGLVAGFISVIVVYVLMSTVSEAFYSEVWAVLGEWFPTSVLWATLVPGGDTTNYSTHGKLLTIVGGTLDGGAFVLVFSYFDLGIPIDELAGGLLWGVVFGTWVGVWTTASMTDILLGINPTANQTVQNVLYHTLYGVVLGLWTGFGVFSMLA